MLRGEIWWADFREPRGSSPGYRRPVLIVQADPFNRSRIATIVVVAISSNPGIAKFPGNVKLTLTGSGLSKESVINVSQIAAIDRSELSKKVGRVSPATMSQVEEGIRLVLEL